MCLPGNSIRNLDSRGDYFLGCGQIPSPENDNNGAEGNKSALEGIHITRIGQVFKYIEVDILDFKF